VSKAWSRVAAILSIGLFSGLAAGMVGAIPLHPEDGFLYGGTPDPRVVIVGIDDKSLRELGAYPLSRHVYADAINKLNEYGARAIALDIGFVGPSLLPGDDALHQALTDSRAPVVLGYGASDLAYGHGSVRYVGEDLAPYWQARCLDQACSHEIHSVSLGASSVVIGSDGRVREAPLLATPPCYPSSCSSPVIAAFGFTAYQAYLGQTLSLLKRIPGGFELPGWQQPLPTGPDGEFEIRYLDRPGAWRETGRYFSLSDLLLGRVDPAALLGRLVMIGADGATGVHDEAAVPGESRLMPGVEVQANVASMFLEQQFLFPESILLTAVAGFLLGGLIAFGVLTFPILVTLPMLLVAGGAYTVLAMGTVRGGVQLNLVGVLGALVLAWAVSVTYRLLRLERRGSGGRGQTATPSIEGTAAPPGT
jgi:CHASE2 domain-containing sensor protein